MTIAPAQKLMLARRSLERWRLSIRLAKAELEHAKASGKSEDVLRFRDEVARASEAWKSAAKLVSDLAPVAEAIGSALRTTLKVEETFAAGSKRWDSEREKESAAKPTQLAFDRRTTRATTVDSPYGKEHGVDPVVRVLHPIEAMHHGRRRGALPEIDDREFMAAQRVREAYEKCAGSIRCALDQEGRGGGGGITSRSPTDEQLQAAEHLADVRKVLGEYLSGIVLRICGEGTTVDEIARSRPDGTRRPPQGRLRGKITSDLRSGLKRLVDFWWPDVRGMEGVRRAKPTLVVAREEWDAGEFRGRVAHASLGKVYGYEPQGGQPKMHGNRKRGAR